MRLTTRRTTYIAGALAALAVVSTAASAQVTTTATTNNNAQLGSAHIVEWDLPGNIDFNPGAVAVDTRGEDNNRAWFVTRLGGQKVYRFDFGKSLTKNNGTARWTSWDLAPDIVIGGTSRLRPSHDRRFVVIRTPQSVQEVDTQACAAGTPEYPVRCGTALRQWTFPAAETFDILTSDIAVDDGRRIFTVGASTDAGLGGFIQMIVSTKVPFTASTQQVTVSKDTATVVRWPDLGVNNCVASGDSAVCLSGIDFQPTSQNQNLIYVSNQGQNSIDELNIATNKIRRWLLSAVSSTEPITEPRQLNIDSNGTVWVITGSGHLVSLNPKNSSGCGSGYNRITRHRIPPEALNDGWGIAPDSHVVGYTDAQNNKVGMLIPRDSSVCVRPTPPEDALPVPVDAIVTPVPTAVVSSTTPGIPKIVQRKVTRKDDGTFVEAVLNVPAAGADPTMAPPDSVMPLGITPAKGKGESTFFYAVGMTVVGGASEGSVAKRVGFVRLGLADRIKNPRDDDDADDGMDRTTHPGWHTSADGDDDADSVPDEYDASTSREQMANYDPAPVAPMTSSPDYAVSSAAGTLALIANAKADNLLATVAIDVYSAAGMLVATSGPMPGVATVTVPNPGAGTFNVRVRNLSGASISVTPTVVTRDLMP